ncbi:MAG: APC family permease [Methanomicrobiales archaeon]|nr:APC family permease [Methanomicrobiales archaeon]MDD1659776.1 APC family permease [Methanomicrobiales archaeon]
MPAENPGRRTYRKSLGMVELVSLGVGGTIGSGIFVVPGIAAGLLGPLSLLAWLVVAVSATSVMLCLAWIPAEWRTTGAFSAIFTRVFGPRVSLALVICYLVSSLFGIATIAAGIGQYLTFFGIPWVLPAEIGIILALLAINLRGIFLSGWTENILTMLKIIPLVAITIFLVPFIRLDHFLPTVPFTLPGLAATMVIVYWPFTGFEISAIPVDETRDTTLITRALFAVMAIVILVYLGLNLALIGSVGSEILASSPAPVARAASVVLPQSGPVVACVGIVAMLSAMNAYIIGTSRVVQNLALGHGLGTLATLGERGTPVSALVLSCLVPAGFLLFTNQFGLLASISVITTLLPYLGICIAAAILLRSGRAWVVAALGGGTTLLILGLAIAL